jgi:hypothetical protein
MGEEKFDVVIFKNKTFGKLLEEIHTNSRANDKLIFGMIEDLKVYIETFGDAVQLAPIIASYVKMAIDNNDHIIKMANVVQKSLEKAKSSDDGALAAFTIEEKKELETLALEWEESLKLPDSTNIKGTLAQAIPQKKRKSNLPNLKDNSDAASK